MDHKLHVLLIDDDEEEYILLRDLIERAPPVETRTSFELDWVDSYDAALEAIDRQEHDAYLIDYRLGPHSGLDLLRYAIATNSPGPVIILTGQGSYEVDMAALRHGAADYLVKSQLTLPLLERSIRYARERAQVRSELERLVEERTLDLERANADLRAEIVRRMEAENVIRRANEELESKVAERTRELNRRAEELQALHAATGALLGTLNLDELLATILDSAQRALPAAEKGWLHLIVPQTGRLHVRSASFRDRRIRRVHFPHSNDFPARAIRERQPLLVEDMLAGDTPHAESSLLDLPAIRSLIVVPLILGEQVLGSLSLGSTAPGAFSSENLHLLTSFAATTTAAIHNAMLHSEVQQLATTDPLTGVYNRRAFEDLGQREIERFERFGHPLAAIMLDIDDFKQINDQHGHAAGDTVLQTLARVCRRNLRKVDIFCRYGGDEFAVLLPETTLSQANEVANRIRQEVAAQDFPTADGGLNVTVSMGVVSASETAYTLQELMERADSALYAAKQQGKNRIESS
ncbi:MAG TPA: diguanylate cyclase [Anaerolineaceae bacterium]|nr:diguanylate cyclase [Anaerolineaceae bacterium]